MANQGASIQITINEILKKTEQLKSEIERPWALLKKIGALGVETSQRAFQEQRLGTIEWPERYPNMSDPIINIAGALSDFSSGRNAPKPNRFQSRPALVDEGTLWKSITQRLIGNSAVAWGSNKDYALTHQEGGQSIQPISEETKERIKGWLFTAEGKESKKKVTTHGREGNGETHKVARNLYKNKLMHLLRKSNLVTNIAARPYLGFTDELVGDIRSTIQEHFKKVQGK